MVVFGLFKKPKSPVVLGSPTEDDIIPPKTPATPTPFTTPVLRNFSYPTSVASGSRTPTFPNSEKTTQTTWDQLGEICTFSPNSPPRAATASEDPFFFSSDQNQYTRILDDEDEAHIRTKFSQVHVDKTPSKAEPNTKKRQRRSVLLGLSTNQTQNTSLFSRSSDTPKTKNKASRGHSLGDHIFPYKSSVAARLKRNSLGQHKVASSFDASQLAIFQSTTPERPASSSGVPVIDTRLRPINSTLGPSPLRTAFERSNIPAAALDMDPTKHLDTTTLSIPDVSGGGRSRGNSTTEYDKRKGKGRWLSQIKDWVSVSEPSTQALKQHKKDTYKRAGIALDDPRANAKLHVSSTTLPPDAIKPCGPGPEPEEVARLKAEQRKKRRQSFLAVGDLSPDSQSSASRDSSASSLPLQVYRDVV